MLLGDSFSLCRQQAMKWKLVFCIVPPERATLLHLSQTTPARHTDIASFCAVELLLLEAVE